MNEEPTTTRKYDLLVIDSVNFAYRTFNTKGEIPVQVSKKSVYRESICRFIDSVEELKGRYLKSDGQVYLLFDNYFSRADLRSTYMFADRRQLDESYKSNRRKESKEFYNSLNFLRYYYLIGPSEYHTLRVDNLEADDLVEPLFTHLGVFDKEMDALMVTTDLDWTRYIDTNVDWLPDLKSPPETVHDLEMELEFPVTKENVIVYKALFGDHSDNIKGLVTDNEDNRGTFRSLLEVMEYPEQLVYLARMPENVKKYPILAPVRDNDRAYLSNLQLVSAIPCGVDVVKFSVTTGRNAETMYRTVRKAIGLEGSEFVFGNIKRNRIS